MSSKELTKKILNGAPAILGRFSMLCCERPDPRQASHWSHQAKKTKAPLVHTFTAFEMPTPSSEECARHWFGQIRTTPSWPDSLQASSLSSVHGASEASFERSQSTGSRAGGTSATGLSLPTSSGCLQSDMLTSFSA